MAEVATLVGTIIGTAAFTIWHKGFCEVAMNHKEKVEIAVDKIINKETEEEVEEEVEEDKSTDYIDPMWSAGDTPRLAFEKIDSVHITKDSARKITNTCKKLLEYYAMEARRKKQFENIRDRLLVCCPDLAREIDTSIFSQCTFYEGKIVLYR
jgi:hypothetical protein